MSGNCCGNGSEGMLGLSIGLGHGGVGNAIFTSDAVPKQYGYGLLFTARGRYMVKRALIFPADSRDP